METFITKSPDYTLVLDALKANATLSEKMGDRFFWTSPMVPIQWEEWVLPYFYIAPIQNSGEVRTPDNGVIKQNDNITICVISWPILSSTECDTLARVAYQAICNSFVLKTCWPVKILSCTKISESPVLFDEKNNVKSKKIALSISYSEA